MYALQLFLSVDPSLGRVDYSLMSDQILMEMLFEGFDDETKEQCQDEHGMYLDVCEWGIIKCDDNDRVIDISMCSDDVSGSLELCYVPPKVKALNIRPMTLCRSQLTGSVDLTGLPDGMESLCLSSSWLMGEIDLAHLPDGMKSLTLHNNQLTGGVDLAHLPDGMKSLTLPSNQFTGGVDLTHLPDEVGFLSLQNNRFTGEINLTRLPARMYDLNLRNNRFTGEIDLTHLPEEMSYLYLNRNELCGSLVIKCLPPGIRCINAQSNKFSDVALVDSEVHADIHLCGSGATSVVDGNGKALDSKPFLECSVTSMDEILENRL